MFNERISSLVVKNYLYLIALSSVCFCVLVFGYIAFQHTNIGKAFYFEKLSQKFPPSSVNAIRFRTIAQALNQGKKTYTFHIKGEPPITQK